VSDGYKKALVQLALGGNPVYVISENDGFLKAYKQKDAHGTQYVFSEKDWFFEIDYNGLKRKVELYHGSGYLSSSSRSLVLPAGLDVLKVFDTQGNWRKLNNL
jgi:hypothetical protein